MCSPPGREWLPVARYYHIGVIAYRLNTFHGYVLAHMYAGRHHLPVVVLQRYRVPDDRVSAVLAFDEHAHGIPCMSRGVDEIHAFRYGYVAVNLLGPFDLAVILARMHDDLGIREQIVVGRV